MKYFFFLDETGDHGLNYIDNNFPLFLLCGCLIREDNLSNLEAQIKNFKQKFFKTENVILHSREIRKCEGPFQILFDLGLKAEFYNDINQILFENKYTIICAAVNKKDHIKKYGKGANDPYSLSLSFILERLIFCLNKRDRSAKIEILVEERGKKENLLLLSHFNSIMDRGTYYVPPDYFKKRVIKFKFHSKRENLLGLQIADLCAYPIARFLINPGEPYKPFHILEKKIYCNEKGRYEGWGLKFFP